MSYIMNLNHEYFLVSDISWREAREVYEYEMGILEKYDWNIKSIMNVELEDDENYETYLEHTGGLDFGIASSVFSLSAAGCQTIWSCNGSEGHIEEFPIIAFRCKESLIEPLSAIARSCGCTLQDGYNGLKELYNTSIQPLMRNAEILIRALRKSDIV